jgi:hypothetical protein
VQQLLQIAQHKGSFTLKLPAGPAANAQINRISAAPWQAGTENGLLSKTKLGSRYLRRYEEKPKTPAQRLLEAPATNEAIKTHLTEILLNTNPLKLKGFIDHHQHVVLSALR